MSDELPSKTITVERRRVERRKMLTEDGNGTYALLYVVTERQGAAWLPISKGYPHSTSAYAKLGRITSNQSQKVNEAALALLYEELPANDGYVPDYIGLTHLGEDYATISVNWRNGEIFEIETNKRLATILAGAGVIDIAV